MNFKRGLLKRKGLLGILAATLSGSSLAAGLSTDQNLICASTRVVACIEGVLCQEGEAQTFDVPTFMFIDFKEKVVRTRGELEGDAKSPIKAMEVTEKSLIMQGIEEHRGWTAAIDRMSGKLTISSTGPEINFIIMGNCTAN